MLFKPIATSGFCGQDLEAAIIAGKTITAPNIIRARQAHAKRPSNRPAQRMAA